MAKNSKGKKEGLTAVTRKIHNRRMNEEPAEQENPSSANQAGTSKQPQVKRKATPTEDTVSKKKQRTDEIPTSSGSQLSVPQKTSEHFKLTRQALIEETDDLLGDKKATWDSAALLDSIVDVCSEAKEIEWKNILNPQATKAKPNITQSFVLKMGRVYMERKPVVPYDQNFGKKIVSMIRKTKGLLGLISSFLMKLLELKTPGIKDDKILDILGEDISKSAKVYVVSSKLGPLWQSPLIIDEAWNLIKGWIKLPEEIEFANGETNPSVFMEVIESYKKVISPHEARKLNLIEMRQYKLEMEEHEEAVLKLKKKVRDCEEKEREFKAKFEKSRIEKALLTKLKSFSSDPLMQLSFAKAFNSIKFPANCLNGAEFFADLIDRTYTRVYHKL